MKPVEKRRIRSIDVVRGLAVVVMIFSHGLRWLHSGRSQDVVSLFGANSLGDMATPVFFVVSGISLGLVTLRRQPNGAALVGNMARLFALGACLSLAWGVLQAQALVLALLALTFTPWRPPPDSRRAAERSVLGLKMPASWRPAAGIAACAFLIHAGMRVAFTPLTGHAEWDHLMVGGFPIFAVLGLASIGFCTASALVREGWERWAVCCGALLMVAAASLHFAGLSVVERSGMSPAFILLGVGLTLTTLGLVELLYDRSRRLQWLDRLLRTPEQVGRFGLFLFVGHYVALALPLHAAGLAGHADTDSAIVGASLFTSLFVAVGLKVGCTSRGVYRSMDQLFGIRRGSERARTKATPDGGAS